MALQLFNTLSRAIEPFEPAEAGPVKMYCCGPTVYDFAHIGNFRSMVFADLVRRCLEFKGWAVTHVMNVTDVEDKIIKAVRKAGTSLSEYTAPFEEAFWKDLRALGCLPPHHAPRATEHITEIVALIERLLARQLAYQASDHSIYFNINKYREAGFKYGQLVQLNFDQMRPGERIQSDDYAKESSGDFALWKARVPEDGNVFWPSPWGEGRPGWHIECSAMSMKILGPSFDLHLGGEDLIFPHHEDEIAQSEGAGLQRPGERFVRCWLHGAHLLVDGNKMSKSLGNYFTLRDLFEKGFTGREVRFLLLSAHYREPFNFTLEGLRGARNALGRLDECLGKLRELAPAAPADPDHELLADFSEALEHDLNVARAWGLVFGWVRETNRQLLANRLEPGDAAEALATWAQMNRVFAVAPLEAGSGQNSSGADGVMGRGEKPIPGEVQQLLEARQQARAERNFGKADEIRARLRELGWVIEDTSKGPRLKPLG